VDAATGQVTVMLAVSDGFGYSHLRSPDRTGPLVAIVGFRLPLTAGAAARIRQERNLLWAATLGLVVAAVVVEARWRRRRAPGPAIAAASGAPAAAVAPPPFSPIPNPYIVGNPIRAPDMFFGREDDFQFARQKLMRERAGVVLVFCGDRRSGKTSILFQIVNGRLGAEFMPVLIDMQYFAAISTDRDFYRNIYREVVRAAHPEAAHRDQIRRYDAQLTDSAAQSFETVLDETMARHPGRNFVFLFDEYELIEAKIDRGELSRNVIPFLAGLLERNRHLAFIFTGSKNLEERATHHWRVMLGKSLYRKISYLTRQDTERLTREPVAGLVDYDAAAVAAIYRLTSGQPFYTQVICQNLVDHLNEVRRSAVGPAEVATIVDAIVDNPLPQMIYFWDSLPAEEKTVLSLLAESLPDESAWSTPSALAGEARAKGVPLEQDEPTLQAAAARLFEKEILAREGGAFQYRVDLLRHWIRRAHSIWQVVKEARRDVTA